MGNTVLIPLLIVIGFGTAAARRMNWALEYIYQKKNGIKIKDLSVNIHRCAVLLSEIN